MKNYKLLNELVRGQWAMTPELVLSYLPIAEKMVRGEGIELEARPTSIMSIYNNGSRVNMQDAEEVPEGSVAVVNLIGVMLKYGTMCEYGADEIVGLLSWADNHKNIVGTVLTTDSGGGAVSAIPVFKNFMANKRKPVFMHADTCASAAYYTGIYCDAILADNDISSQFGSIGVMISFADYRGMYEKNGVKFHTIYATQSTHKNKPFEEALEGKYELLQTEVLDQLAAKFQADVKANRPKLDAKVDGILNGRMFYAKDALKYGLIDGMATLEEAIDRVKLRAMSSNY